MYVLNKFKKDIAPQDTERDDTGKQIVLEALIKKILLVVALFIASIIVLIVMKDILASLCVFAFCLFMAVFVVLHYINYRKENYTQIVAVCIGKSRSGYRRQYFNYDFQVVDSEIDAFEILTASKKKFRVGYTYKMVFEGKNPTYSTQSLLGFEHIGSKDIKKRSD